MEVSLDSIASGDIRNNALYKRILSEHRDVYQKNLETNNPEDHIGFVKAQSALAALRLLHEALMEPSEIHEINNERD